LDNNRNKIILAVVLLVAAGSIALFSMRPSKPLSDSIKTVCAATGKVYDISRAKLTYVPYENPSTGEKTLFPCREVDGVLVVRETFRLAVQQLGDKNKCIDPNTLTVRKP
jgi:hypothetical protein